MKKVFPIHNKETSTLADEDPLLRRDAGLNQQQRPMRQRTRTAPQYQNRMGQNVYDPADASIVCIGNRG